MSCKSSSQEPFSNAVYLESIALHIGLLMYGQPVPKMEGYLC